MHRYLLLSSLVCCSFSFADILDTVYVINPTDVYSTSTSCISYCDTTTGSCQVSGLCAGNGSGGCCTLSNAIAETNTYAYVHQSLEQTISIVPSEVSVAASSGTPTIGTFIRPNVRNTINFTSTSGPTVINLNNPYGSVSPANFNAIANMSFSSDVSIQDAYIVLNGGVVSFLGNEGWSGNLWYLNRYSESTPSILFQAGSYSSSYADQFILPAQTVFTVAADTQVYLGGQISGSPGLILLGNGTFSFTNANNLMGQLVIGAEYNPITVTVQGSSTGSVANIVQGPLGTGPVVIQWGSRLLGLTSCEIQNSLLGQNDVSDLVHMDCSSGVFTLSGNKQFTGIVSFNDGYTAEIYLQGENTIGTMYLSGGVLRLSNQGSYAFNSLQINSSLATLTFDNNMELGSPRNSLVLNACISSGGSCVASGQNVIDDGGYETAILSKIVGGDFSPLVKRGSGVITLQNISNTYSGGTDILEGALAIAGGNNGIPIQTLGTGSIILRSQSRLLAKSGGILSNTIVVPSFTEPSYLDVADQTILGLNGTVSILGTEGLGGGLVLNGLIGSTGTLELLHAVDAGALYVLGGTLALGANSSFSSSSTLYLEGGGLGFLSPDYTLADATIYLGPGANFITDFGYPVAISSVLTGPGQFVKQGSGIIALTSNGTFTGGTEITQGKLELDSLQRINYGEGGLTLSGGALLLAATDALPGTTQMSVIGSGSVLQVPPLVTLTIDAPIVGSGSLSITGGGRVTVTGDNSFAGSIEIVAATLSIGAFDNLYNASSIFLTGGNLNIENTLTLPADIAVISGINTIPIAEGQTFTSTGIISGPQASTLAIQGGTFVVTGYNSFNGILDVVSGTIEASSGNNLGMGPAPLILRQATLVIPAGVGIWSSDRVFTIQENATVNIAPGATAAFTQSISTTPISSSILVKQGGGRFALLTTGKTGIISHIFIEEGEMAGNGQTLHSSQIDIAAGASLVFAQEGTGSYIGAPGASITGAGQVVIDGTGTLSLLATNNTYEGGTKLAGGILQIESDVLGIGSGPVIGSGGTLSLTKNFTTIRPLILVGGSQGTISPMGQTLCLWAGDVTGGGDLVKQGTGKLVLSGTNDYTGKTYVLQGELSVISSIVASGDPYVAKGALLRGSGSVGDTQLYGAVVGGDPLGTLSIEGNVIAETGSWIGTFITSTDSSLIDVTGDVTLSTGVTYTAGFFAGAPTHDLEGIVLQAGSITGTFTAIESPPIYFLAGDLSYADTEIDYTFTQREIEDLAIGTNAEDVAEALDAAVEWNRKYVSCHIVSKGFSCTANERLPDVLSSLIDFTTKEEMTQALDQLQPASLLGMTILQEHTAIDVRKSVSQRIEQELDLQYCFSMSSSRAVCQKGQAKAWSVWGYGLGDVLLQKNTENDFGTQIGYLGKMAGIVGGIDWAYKEHFSFGAMGGYTTSNIDWQERGGSGHIHTGYAGVYASAKSKRIYANASLIGQWSGYSARRNIHYPHVQKTATNHHSGRGLLSHIDVGLHFPIQGFTIRPFDSLDYLTQGQGAFQEKGAGEWNLQIQKQGAILLRNELGLQFASCFCFKVAKLTVTPTLSWVREVRMKGGELMVAFVGEKDFFSSHGYFPDRNLISPGVAFMVDALQDRLSVSLYYNAELRSGYSAQNFCGGARYRF